MSGSTSTLAISASELLQQPKLDVAAWAGEKLTPAIFDVLGHFLLSHRSIHTRMAYARDVLEFLVFAEDSGRKIKFIPEVTEILLLQWKDALSRKHTRFDETRRRVANASVARKLCTLSSLLDFAVKRDLLPENPMEHVSRPRVRRESHAAVLNEEELTRILQTAREHANACAAAIPTEKSSPLARRAWIKAETEWCLLVLLFTVGMRVSEICQLKLKDITVEGDLTRLSLLTKGARRHSPLIHPDSSRVLAEFIGRFRPGANPEEPVFIASQGKSGKILPLHRSTVFRMVRDAAKRAGIERPFSPHGCRATLATQLHLAEIPVVEIQSLLNHAQVTTTQLYLHRVDDLRESAALKLPWAQSPRTSSDR
ncbi:MAG: tyrosine-type recombinase/integrase [Silvanigrellaceae bacterium]